MQKVFWILNYLNNKFTRLNINVYEIISESEMSETLKKVLIPIKLELNQILNI